MRRRTVLLAVAALGAALAAGGALSATTSVTITTPKAGQKVSLHQNPYLAVAGKVTFADTSAGTTRFFLRRDGCGTSADNPHLSLTAGNPDAGDGCGLIVDQVGLVGDAAPEAAFTDYPAVDGMPLAFDGTKPITGQVSLSGAQVGVAEVTVDVQALVGGSAVDLGSTTATAVLDPTGASTPVPFSIPAEPSLDGSDVQALDLRVTIHGPNVYSGFTALSGASYMDVPSYAASVNKTVLVSVDDSSFANAVPARLSGSTWSVAVPTPAVGKHTLYAESTQGYTTSAPTSLTFTVTK
ncbi:MAG TPA: hypothetical protein VKR79_07210 [Gaiellaceae bacterium]|nr:hypothetical protein [Gaiellaceae bacterium]